MDIQPLIVPFVVGLVLGLIFALLAVLKQFELRAEIKRLKLRLENDAEFQSQSRTALSKEVETLRKENEHLRVGNNLLMQTPDRKVRRDLEVYARAEKIMVRVSPGFPGAWEDAKSQADKEIAEEEAGRSLPKRVFSKLLSFGGSGSKPPSEGSR